MLLLRLIEILAVLMLVTQVVFPLLRGTLFFPLFRKEKAILHKIDEVKQEIVETKLEKEYRKYIDQLIQEKKINQPIEKEKNEPESH